MYLKGLQVQLHVFLEHIMICSTNFTKFPGGRAISKRIICKSDTCGLAYCYVGLRWFIITHKQCLAEMEERNRSKRFAVRTCLDRTHIWTVC